MTRDVYASNGKLIREFRNQYKITQKKLSESTGFSPSKLSRLERGELPMNDKTYNVLYCAINFSVAMSVYQKQNLSCIQLMLLM